MATAVNLEVQINATLIQYIRELETLVESYRLTNDALRNALDDRQKQLNAALGSARKLEKQLDVALQEARRAAQDCGTALEQRDRWKKRTETLSDLVDQREMVVRLNRLVDQCANQKEAARFWEVSESYLSDVLSGWRQPGAKICKAVGYERVTMYRKVEE